MKTTTQAARISRAPINLARISPISGMLRVNAMKGTTDLSRLGDGGAAVGCDVTGEP
jgi:hypothetical protein